MLGATEHNLKNIDVRIPLGRLVCVTGVSGSGKSTLVRSSSTALRPSRWAKPIRAGSVCTAALRNASNVGAVVMVDQSPIGDHRARTRRATWVLLIRCAALCPRDRLSSERNYTAGSSQLQLRGTAPARPARARLRARRDAVPPRRLPALP